MYKILVADDEQWIRKAIVKRLMTLGLDLEVVAEASDGKEAYQLAIETQPDIILTDIRMPYMNGITFIEKLREHLPNTKVIIITGYADFEYARSALQLRVFRYILKTVDDDTLKETLKEAIEHIQKERTAIGELKTLKAKLAERTHILQKNFIYELLSEKVSSEEYINRMIENLDLPFRLDNYFNIMVLQLDNADTNHQNISDSIQDLNKFFHEKHYTCFILENVQGYKELNILLYASVQNQLAKLRMTQLSKDLIESFSHLPIFIGISNTYKNCVNLNRAYIEAIDALKNKNLSKNKKSRYIYFEDVSISENFTNLFTSADERNLAYYIEMGNFPEIEHTIASIFENIHSNTKISTKLLMKLYFEIVLLLENLLNKYQLSVEKVLGIDFLSLVNTPKTSSIDTLKDILKSFAIKVSEYLVSIKNDNPKASLDAIKNYIENNYFENITLDTIAQKFFISKTYFSQLFKKEMGITFISFLTKIRMEHAIQLLKNNDLKVHEVAKMVGYSDPLYFGQVFKKHFGVLPSEYNS